MYYMFNTVNTKPNILNLETLNWTQGMSSPISAGEGSCLVALRDSIIVLGGSNFKYVQLPVGLHGQSCKDLYRTNLFLSF